MNRMQAFVIFQIHIVGENFDGVIFQGNVVL